MYLATIGGYYASDNYDQLTSAICHLSVFRFLLVSVPLAATNDRFATTNGAPVSSITIYFDTVRRWEKKRAYSRLPGSTA
jgi:hypothetical protein